MLTDKHFRNIFFFSRLLTEFKGALSSYPLQTSKFSMAGFYDKLTLPSVYNIFCDNCFFGMAKLKFKRMMTSSMHAIYYI